MLQVKRTLNLDTFLLTLKRIRVRKMPQKTRHMKVLKKKKQKQRFLYKKIVNLLLNLNYIKKKTHIKFTSIGRQSIQGRDI